MVVACLLRNADAGARAESAGARFASSWPLAYGPALSHPGMQSAARECFAAAFDALGDAGADRALSDAVAEYAERFVARGRTPADERLDAFRRTGSPLLAEDGCRMVGASR